MWQLRRTLRALHHSPGFTFTAVLVLGLGLGANTVVFNAVYALLWRPLPFPDANRLVVLRHRSATGAVYTSSSGRDVADIRNSVRGVAEIGLVGGGPKTAIALGDSTADLETASVNAGYLRALGLHPLVGRLFGDEEDRGEAKEGRAILTESAWRAYFGADPSVAGRVVQYLAGAERRPMRIVGVIPDRYTLPFITSAQLLAPIPWLQPGVQANRSNLIYQAMLRLKPGVHPSDVSNQVTAALRSSEQELPLQQRGARSWLDPLRTALVGTPRTPVSLLYAAAGLLLALTITNVASLVLSRAVERSHELALRGALGATLGRTLWAFFLEALAVCGGGLVLAFLIGAWLQPLVPRFVPELTRVGVNLLEPGLVMVAFGLGMCLLAALIMAALPTLQARRGSLAEVLGRSGRSATARAPWRTILASAQMAIILVLLAVGSLIGRSFVQALRVDPRFDATNVLTFKVTLPVPVDARPTSAMALRQVLAALPGTTRIGFSAESPIGDFYSAIHASHGGEFRANDPMIAFRLVDTGYFQALRAHVVRGRGFVDEEVLGARDVVVVNETAARELFEGQDPIGRTIHSGLGNNTHLTVVGLVKDIKSDGLDVAAPPMLYLPYMPFFNDGVIFSVRTTASPATYEAAVRNRVKAWNPVAVVRDVKPLDDDLRKTIQSRFRAATLVGLFALLGLVIGSVGLYATVAGNVQRLTREIGIRVALGASRGSVLRRVVAQGGRLVAIGGAAGLVVALAGARLMRAYLFGIEPLDAVSFAIALGLLCAAGLVATIVPARRAVRIDPAVALRGE